MNGVSGKEPKDSFSRLMDTARVALVGIEKHGRSVVAVVSVEEYERLKAIESEKAGA
jgi:PHD/YefM family antitoxin component YafN of YafNO toxin-antitoxin module